MHLNSVLILSLFLEHVALGHHMKKKDNSARVT